MYATAASSYHCSTSEPADTSSNLLKTASWKFYQGRFWQYLTTVATLPLHTVTLDNSFVGVHGLDFPEPHPATMKHHVGRIALLENHKSVNSLPQKILHGWHISSWTCDLTCHSLHIATTHTPHNIILTAFAGEYLSWDKSVSIAPVG